MRQDKKQYRAGRVVGTVAAAWRDTIILELSDELKQLSLHQRAVAIEFIYERCRRSATEQVNKLLEKESIQNDIASNPDKHVEFLILTKHLQSGKYLKRVIDQLRKLMPKWRDDNFIDVQDLYAELYQSKESFGEQE